MKCFFVIKTSILLKTEYVSHFVHETERTYITSLSYLNWRVHNKRVYVCLVHVIFSPFYSLSTYINVNGLYRFYCPSCSVKHFSMSRANSNYVDLWKYNSKISQWINTYLRIDKGVLDIKTYVMIIRILKHTSYQKRIGMVQQSHLYLSHYYLNHVRHQKTRENIA